jgi:hypothetical protein
LTYFYTDAIIAFLRLGGLEDFPMEGSTGWTQERSAKPDM